MPWWLIGLLVLCVIIWIAVPIYSSLVMTDEELAQRLKEDEHWYR